jgi:hypothetical protein
MYADGARRGDGGHGAREQLGDAEVGELRGAVRPEQQVLRLHVPVEDVTVVGVAERGADREGQRHGFVEGHPRPAEPLPERAARQVLHDDEVDAVTLDVVVDRDDVGVVERGDQPGLAREPRPQGRIGAERGGELLDRHVTAQVPVVSLVDDTPTLPVRARGRSRRS